MNHISRFYRFLWFATHIINQWSNASFVWFSVKTNWKPCFWRWNIFQSSVNLSKKIHHLLFCRLHFLLSYRHNWTVNFPQQYCNNNNLLFPIDEVWNYFVIQEWNLLLWQEWSYWCVSYLCNLNRGFIKYLSHIYLDHQKLFTLSQHNNKIDPDTAPSTWYLSCRIYIDYLCIF